ncbi:hypothetical protein ABH917_000836 [Thermobifida halotolerans]
MVPCSAVLGHLARLLAAHRRTIGTPRCSQALTSFRQAVLVLRHFHDGSRIHTSARGHAANPATACRYVREGIHVLAAQVPTRTRPWMSCASWASSWSLWTAGSLPPPGVRNRVSAARTGTRRTGTVTVRAFDADAASTSDICARTG